MSVKAIKIETAAARTIMLAVTAALLTGAVFSLKWALAHAASLKVDDKAVAGLTVDWAPDDPQTHYVSAVLHERTFLPEDIPVSLAEYEKAAALAPNNYLLWLELGNARGRNGDLETAERTLRKALELAPNYAQVHWALGNNLLRQGRSDEAFAEIRLAASADEKYTHPAAAVAWQVFDGDIALIRRTIGDSPLLNVALMTVLQSQKRLDEAVAVWETLSPEDKRVTYRQTSIDLYGHLVDTGRYRAALSVFSSVLAPEREEATPERIWNGGFEKPVDPQNAAIFDWRIADGPKPQIAADTAQKHSGTQSLVLIFDAADDKDFRQVSQTIVVESGKNYQLELFYKSDLRSAATIKWEAAAVNDGKILGFTEPVAATADWTLQRFKFSVPPATDAVSIRLVRAACGGLCPLTGRIWFDDLKLSAE